VGKEQGAHAKSHIRHGASIIGLMRVMGLMQLAIAMICEKRKYILRSVAKILPTTNTIVITYIKAL